MKFSTVSLRALAICGAGLALAPAQAMALEAEDAAAAEADAQETGATAPQAQDDTAQQDGNAVDIFNDVIVVTGTKTRNPEDVQDVPVAVTAFNDQTLEALKIRDIQGLSFQAPSVSLDQIGTSRGTANFSIRGLGINSSIPSIDPTVGVFVDGVYLGFNGGVVFDLFDLDSVEVLRGPQGILFGRNTTGGAVLVNTGNPTEEFQGKFRAAVETPVDSGRGGQNYFVSGVVSGPIIEDVLLFKLGAYYNNDEGYFRNLFDGSDFGAAETYILRGALEFRPTSNLTILGKFDYFDSEGDGPAGQNRGTFDRNSFDFSIDEPGFYDTEVITGSVKLDWEIGPGVLTNIFGYREFSGTTLGDIDALPEFIFHSNTLTEQEQISNELRYAMSFDGIELTVGSFFFDQSIAYDELRDLPPTGLPTFSGGGQQDHQVLGLFAQGQFYVTDSLSLIGGIRWSREEKDGSVSYIIPRAEECSVVAGTCPTTGTDGFTDNETWTNWSPKLGFQYEFANSQIYGHWTRGFRSGGFNFRITDPAAFLTQIVPATGSFLFDEERVDTFEIGGKFQTEDGAFTLNAAAYVTKINNMQREINQPGAAGVSQFILNSADATIMGFEAEARMRVSDNLLFTANIGLIDDEYDEILFDISGVTGVNGVVDEEDFALSIPRVPTYTWGVGAIHELDLGSSSITSRFNLQYRDEFAYTDNNLGWIQDITNLEANVTWNTPIEGLSLSIYGRNLLDEVQAGGDTQLSQGLFGGPLSTGVAQPFAQNPTGGTFSPLARGRQLGAEIQFEF
ncbi:TonB-dependent receptor [Alterisphingorhabdus coralli]|uniref:TonB-dependent receptor n=1 Tax=Alterisphingorhabdus coralli TaxID=3071408 RepID=A0AA97F9M8_9SPHN|nr:TonB-dependent receptor [Parasphingorhabdus sp. SCSIO 66989]WOE75803.1 TonB-dependent receptor [Parasphingorhabdus sp. SCSIO 66989]